MRTSNITVPELFHKFPMLSNVNSNWMWTKYCSIMLNNLSYSLHCPSILLIFSSTIQCDHSKMFWLACSAVIFLLTCSIVCLLGGQFLLPIVQYLGVLLWWWCCWSWWLWSCDAQIRSNQHIVIGNQRYPKIGIQTVQTYPTPTHTSVAVSLPMPIAHLVHFHHHSHTLQNSIYRWIEM